MLQVCNWLSQQPELNAHPKMPLYTTVPTVDNACRRSLCCYVAYCTAGVVSWRGSHFAACFGSVARWALVRLRAAVCGRCVPASSCDGLQQADTTTVFRYSASMQWPHMLKCTLVLCSLHTSRVRDSIESSELHQRGHCSWQHCGSLYLPHLGLAHVSLTGSDIKASLKGLTRTLCCNQCSRHRCPHSCRRCKSSALRHSA
jgi:hypothetical protein